MQPELFITADGSHSLINRELNVSYHSTHGAVQESRHIFIEAGFRYAAARFDEIRILEVGFGTGLNALLSYEESLSINKKVYYDTVEKYPISLKLASQLNYAENRSGELKRMFLDLHESEWEKAQTFSENFVFRKHRGDVNHLEIQQPVHLVYFDAFAPDDAPDMWNDAIFRTLYASMVEGACLVSFCAKGHFKRVLKSLGFQVETLPGPKGKREMTRAIRVYPQS